jgi:hypothetical protein
MRRVVAIALIAGIGVAACGGQARRAQPRPARPAPDPALAQISGSSYTVQLIGTAHSRDASSGAGTATVSINRKPAQLCWHVLALRGTARPLFAHINRGTVRDAGPIVVPLGAAYTRSGCVSGVAPSLLAGMERDPRGYYLDVTDSTHPLGAIRGQL